MAAETKQLAALPQAIPHDLDLGFVVGPVVAQVIQLEQRL
jgi:hypothetical protein